MAEIQTGYLSDTPQRYEITPVIDNEGFVNCEARNNNKLLWELIRYGIFFEKSPSGNEYITISELMSSPDEKLRVIGERLFNQNTTVEVMHRVYTRHLRSCIACTAILQRTALKS